MLASPGSAATPPTIPFDSTADLLVAENGCDCIVEIAEDGTPTVLVTTADIAGGDTDALDATDVDFNESGLAIAADGTAYVVNSATSSILSIALDGTVSTVASGTDIAVALGTAGGEEGGLDVEKLAFGPDGTLYATEDGDQHVFAVDVTTGAITVIAEESDFESLAEVSNVDLTGGIAVDADGLIYVASDSTPEAVFTVTTAGVVTLLASAPNEVQGISTDATGGTFTITFDGEETGSIAYDAAAADVQTAMEALSNIDPGDVAVAGTGTELDPWRITFTGTYAATDVPDLTTDDSGLTGGTTTTNEEVEGGGFEDLDLYATLDGDGVLVIGDDDPATIFRITSTGDIDALIVESQFEAVADGGNDPEGGLAYDEDGVLYISEEDSGDILQLDGSSLSVFVQDSALLGATDSTPELDGGIAFRMPIVDVSPAINAPTEGVAGETLTYDVVVSNAGPDTIDGFEFSSGDALEGAGITAASGSFDGTLWTGDLASGDDVTFTVTGTIPSDATGTLGLTATSTAALGAIDTDTSNDSDTATVDLSTSADLVMDKAAPESVAVGDSTELTLTVTNDGPSDATDVEVGDDLPAGLVLDATAGDGWTCTDGESVTCTRADLAAGASSVLTLTVSTDVECTSDSEGEPVCSAGGSEVTAFENTATVSSATADPDDSNNSDSATTTLDTSDVEVAAAGEEALPAAGASTSQWALMALLSILLGAVLLARTAPARRRSIA